MFFPRSRVSFRLLQILCVLLCVAPVAAQDISVQLDGRTLQFDQPPAMIGGRLMVPLRGIFEALKADVVYDAATRSIQATKGSRVVQLQLGSRTAIIDGRTLFLDVPADTIGGRTMVPLRFVSESLGAEVKWEGATKTVRLSSAGGDSTTQPPDNNQGNNSQSNNSSGNGPRIDQVFHSATTVLKAGDPLDVIIYGEPGGQASFEIMGATKQLPLPEVSPGKYQSRWTIPNGLQVEQGVLLAHLSKNGRETAVEAQRQVTVRGSNGSNTNTGTSNGWQVAPTADGVTADYRPQLTANFPQAPMAGTIRLFVDGVDFTNQARLVGQQLQWQPSYNLSAGTHQVEVQATGAGGQALNYNWNFRIDPNANSAGNLGINKSYPEENATVSARPQIGAIFTQNLQSVTLRVDTLTLSNQPGISRYQNGILWTPTYDLSAGQHQVSVTAVATNGQVMTRSWNFVVGANSISNFVVSPTSLSAGQVLTVNFDGPSGAIGTFSVGGVSNLSMREVSSGRYQGQYTARSQDSGTATVTGQLRLSNGQVLQANAPTQVTFSAPAGQLSVSNLSNGMTISPVFNVQGKGQPGRTVSVLVEYQSGSILGGAKTIRTQGVVSNAGFYDIPVDSGVIRSGQSFRLTVSDGVSPSVVLNLTRQ